MRLRSVLASPPKPSLQPGLSSTRLLRRAAARPRSPALGPLHRRSRRLPLRRTGWALTAFGVALALVAVFARGASADSSRRPRSTTSPRPRRLLVLSLPATTWADLDPATTPHLVKLLDDSAVADLNTRSANGFGYSFNIAPQPAALIMTASKSSMGKAAMFFRAISFAVSRRPA